MIHKSSFGDFEAEMLCDSVSPCGKRLSTMRVKYWRAIHSEIMTHRMLSRNSASSRAIPWEKVLANGNLSEKCMKGMISMTPFVPHYWGLEQKGMQSGDEVDQQTAAEAEKIWLEAKESAVWHADRLAKLGIHKSICNRLVEPFMYITVIISATDWNNFWHLRIHKDAEKHFQELATLMKQALDKSVPKSLAAGEWHLPYIDDDDRKKYEEISFKELEKLVGLEETFQNDTLQSALFTRVSSGRVARVSYLTHDGRRSWEDDVNLFKRLMVRLDNNDPVHSSPTEHIAVALSEPERHGNFVGWKQFRKFFTQENIPG